MALAENVVEAHGGLDNRQNVETLTAQLSA
jgi:hypothetical protein